MQAGTLFALIANASLIASKSNNYSDSWKSDNYRKWNGGMKQRNWAKKNKGDNFTKSNREKFNITIAILEKFIIVT